MIRRRWEKNLLAKPGVLGKRRFPTRQQLHGRRRWHFSCICAKCTTLPFARAPDVYTSANGTRSAEYRIDRWGRYALWMRAAVLTISASACLAQALDLSVRPSAGRLGARAGAEFTAERLGLWRSRTADHPALEFIGSVVFSDGIPQDVL